MAGKSEVGITLSVGGEKEYTQGLNNATKVTKLLQQEAKSLSQEYDGQANTLEALQRTQENLTAQQEAFKNKLEAAKSGLANARKEYEKQSEAVKKLRTQLEDAEDALKDMEDAGESGSDSYKKQQEKVDSLTTALKKQTEGMLTAEGRVTDWNRKVVSADSDLRKANKAVEENAKYLDEAKSSTDGCAKSIDEFGKKADTAADDVDELGDAADDAAESSDTLKNGLAAALSTAAGNLAADAVRELGDAAKEAAEYVIEVGSNFEAAMSEVEAISGASGSDLDQLTEKAKELGSSTKFTATEVAEAFKYMSLAGWDTQDMLDGVDGVLDLAAAASMDLADASDIVTDYLSAFGLTAADSTSLVDKMAYAMSHSNTDVEQLGEAYKNCAATATQLGYGLDETTAALMVMADAGIKGGEAGTGLAAIMTRLGNNTSGCTDLLSDYGIEVYDAEGNTNSLSDILTGMQGVWSGLTDEQKSNLAYTVAGKSAQAQLMTVLGDTTGSLETYTEGLANCDGTAKNMADTMQDNLKGAITKASSAAEGLGVALYDKVSGPLTDAVNIATGLISGITDVIAPQKTAFEEFADEISTANDDLKETLDSANTEIENAELDAGRIETLGRQLMSLNSVEDKSLAQKYQLKAVVDELSASIPEIGDAYNEATGEIDLNNESIQNLITSTEELMVAQATRNAMQEVTNELVDAEIKLNQAETAQAAAADKKAMYEEEMQLLQDLEAEYSQYEQAMAFAMDADDIAEIEKNYTNAADVESRYMEFWNKQLETGRATIDEYNEAMKNVGVDQLSNRISNNERSLTEWSDATDEAGKTLEEYSANVQTAQENFGETSEAASNATDEVIAALTQNREAAGEAATAYSELTKAQEENSSATDANAAKQEQLAQRKQETADAAEENADALGEESGALADNTTAAEEAASAQEAAMQTIKDAYSDALDTIREQLRDKISITDAFDGGEDLTAEDLTANLQSYIDGVEKYQENLAKVREMTDENGQAIFSDEVMSEIEAQGTDFANILQNIVSTWEDYGDTEGVKELAQSWAEALDITDSMAETEAAAQTAKDAIDNVFSSSDADFSGLREAIDTAVSDTEGSWAGLSDAEREGLEATIQLAEEMGAQIPEGLAESIESGETDVSGAIAALQGSMEGQAEAFTQMAQDIGIKIPADIAEGLASGGQDMVAAYQKLIELIAENTSAAQTAGEEAGAATTEAMQSGIEAGEDGVSAAASSVSEGGAEALSDGNSAYSDAGKEASSQYASGISGMSSTVRTAASGVGKEAVSGFQSGASGASTAGYAMATGVAAGIRSGASAAINAAANMASQALAAAKSALAISSPSKKFKKDVGEQIAKGTALGISDKASLAGKAASEMSAKVYKKATSWLSKYKKAHETSLDDEKYYWEQVLKHVKQGTSAYNKAVKQLATVSLTSEGLSTTLTSKTAAKISNNFGVSKTTGSGKNKKTKSTADYYNEIYEAAEKYLKQQNILNEWSLEQELAYWEAVKAQLKKGTDAWYDATEQINNLKDDIAKAEAAAVQAAEDAQNQIVKDAEDYMRKQKILRDVSLEEELAYWEKTLAQLESGTDAWYDAMEKVKDLEEEIADATAKAAEEAAEAEEEAANAAKEALQTQASVQSTILSRYKTYYKVSAKAEVDYWNLARKQFKSGTDERIEADQKYLEALQDWYDQRRELDEDYAENSREINEQLADDIEDLQDAYEDAVESRKNDILSQMDLFESWDATGYDADTPLYNLKTQVAGLTLWEQQLEELGKKGLSSDLMDELASMGPDAAANIYSLNQMTAEQLDEYEKLWEQKNALATSQAVKDSESLRLETNSKIAQLRADAQAELSALNAEYVAAVAELNTGISDELAGLVEQSGEIGEEAISELIAGMGREADSVETYDSTTEIVEGISGQLSALEQAGETIGKNTLDGMLAALTDYDKINAAARSVIQSVKMAMEEEAEIHSPSQLFRRETGPQIPAGLAAGIEDGLKDAEESARTVVDGMLTAAKDEMMLQQAELQAQAAALDYSGINRLNSALENYNPPQVSVAVDNSSISSMMGQVLERIEALAENMGNLQVMLDGDTLVGGIRERMSRADAAAAIRRNRGLM